jgi:Tfp pilus assembly protein PilN
MHRWDEVLSALAHCLPENVWLERLEAGRRGNVSLKGASYGEEGTYELSRWLSGVPGFAAVQLEGMQPQRLPTGLVTKFDMKFDLAGQATPAKEAGKNE